MAKIWGYSHTTHWRSEREGKSGSGRLCAGRMGSATSWWCRFVMVRQNWHCLSPSLMTLFVWRNNPCRHILCARHEGGNGGRRRRNGRRGKTHTGNGDIIRAETKKNKLQSKLYFFHLLKIACRKKKKKKSLYKEIIHFNFYIVLSFYILLRISFSCRFLLPLLLPPKSSLLLPTF